MPSAKQENRIKMLALYKQTNSLRQEILKHKWIESEKLGYDIGIYKATIDWIEKYYPHWKKEKQKMKKEEK
ncbi:hypothetical protein B9J78_00560 [bacterium Unc6]|nr:hypothetical protein [bacterium Unc6]